MVLSYESKSSISAKSFLKINKIPIFLFKILNHNSENQNVYTFMKCIEQIICDCVI